MRDATDLAAAIAAGQLSATACMQASIEAAERLSGLGALARLDPERGLTAARAFDESDQSKGGPFAGVPFLAKDLGGYAAGLGPVAGSAALAKVAEDPDHDDDLFGRFRAAGFLPFGLTKVPEFGLALTSEPPGAPPALNPFDRGYSPGGSSGGAGAAVAAGIVSIAHATDAAGSTRVPAACCGLVGLKASRGRVTGAPHFNNYLMGIASEQVLTRSVRDAQAVFDAVKHEERPVKPIKRIGLCVPQAASADTASKMDALVSALSDNGLEFILVPPIDALGDRAMALTLPVFAASLADWLDSVGVQDSDVTPINAAMAARGRAMSAPQLFSNSVEMMRLGYEAEALFTDIDAMIMPVLANGPPMVGHFDPNQTDVEGRLAQMNALAPNVALANSSGLPALAMPFGMLPEPRAHLPFGIQILGPQGSDEALFDLAGRIETLAPPIRYPHPLAGAA